MDTDSGSAEAMGRTDERSATNLDADGIELAELRCAVSLGEPREE